MVQWRRGELRGEMVYSAVEEPAEAFPKIVRELQERAPLRDSTSIELWRLDDLR